MIKIFYDVMYSGVECVCGGTLSVYPHRAAEKSAWRPWESD